MNQDTLHKLGVVLNKQTDFNLKTMGCLVEITKRLPNPHREEMVNFLQTALDASKEVTDSISVLFEAFVKEVSDGS